ncbi:MAG: MCE family protein [Beijerinckiaceae bacterium]|nr:MCE family protein [Beijerinckiaceae bacterium]MDO9441508.1 MlaD family protein [Beijerinckiaceae bacterium]
METRANYALIGAFTLAVVTAAFMFVFWFSGSSKQSGRDSYRVVFSSSVSGLTRGSQVLFNGLKVGEVTSIDLAPDPSEVFAIIDVDRRTPVKTDTRARLEYQGLTGVGSIALTGGSSDAPRLTSTTKDMAEIRAERSDFQNLVETLQNLSSKVDGLLNKADSLVTDNATAISKTVQNVQVFTDALAANSDGLKDFLGGMADLGRTIRPLAQRLEGLTGTLDKLVSSVDTEKVRSIVSNVEDFSTSLARNKTNIDSLLTDAAKVARDLGAQTSKLDSLMSSAGDITKAVDPKKVANAVDSLDRFATVLDNNRQNTDSIMKNANELTAKLNASADKIDGVLASVQGFLGGPGSEGMFSDVGEAAKAIRKLADNLDVRTKEITAGINRFTGPGLKQYEALATDGRRTLDEINRTVRSLGKNPQQLIFGGKPSVPEYSGR